VFPAERSVLWYEHSDRAYTVEPFFLAYNAIEIPIEIISSFGYTAFALVVVGLNTTWTSFFCMTLVTFCLVNVGESIGLAFCALVDHVGFSVSLTNSVLGVFTVMSGLMSASMPLFLDRLNRISPVPYFTRLMTINEFDSNARFTCTQAEIQTRNCLYRNGEDVLRLLTGNSDVFAFESDKFVFYLVVGCAITVSYRMIAYLILKFRAQ
jgi:hypothetical protein